MESGLREHVKIWDPLFISATELKLATSIWYTTWAWGVAYQETTFRTKTGGGLG